MKRNLLLFGIFILMATVAFSQKDEKVVEIMTSMGNIKVKLYNETPLHRDNFLNLAETGAVNGSIFHRVIKGFMVQGGGKPGSNGAGSIGATIPAEILPGFIHKKGALCAARMGDQVNPKKESSGSQFYIVQGRIHTENDLNAMEPRKKQKFTKQQQDAYTTIGGTPHLDGDYTVFGEVIEGLDIIDKIAGVPTSRTIPNTPIEINLKAVK